ncbi:dTMP kinase [Synechococcales cyanobacterium C]|uniref:Thymidylate kinase n=1 Tax=Petrachloros mirabilis ULC683 TaxID=2781853 RepID=A0A8K1ZW01_9CYAN|nr:dTMP kinase [Petrachloros mirabilis]NCJ05161.1 dTMP kinase [Petrachloros mirabilis ULC683]
MGGKLVVFEGGEGAGKTTQISQVQAWLRDSGWVHRIQTALALPASEEPLCLTREPGGTDLGQRLRALLLDGSLTTAAPMQAQTELLLYAADRSQHVTQVLKPKLQSGYLVLCDRFTDSTVAYQGYGRGLDLNLIDQLNQIATAGLESDLTFWLDLEAEVGLNRVHQRLLANTSVDRMEADTLEFHRRVQSGFTALARQYPQRIVRVEAQASEVEVTQVIQTVLEERLKAWYPQLSPTS